MRLVEAELQAKLQAKLHLSSSRARLDVLLKLLLPLPKATFLPS